MQKQNIKKYWLRLFPETFLWSKNGQSLIYNAKDKISFKFKNTEFINQITDQLQNLVNLYCIELSEDELKESQVNQLITQIEETSSGEIIEVATGHPKPITLVPFLNIQSDVERIRKDNPMAVGDHILNYLHSVTFVLNGNISTLNPDWDYQTKAQEKMLSPAKIITFLNNIENSTVGKVNIISEKIGDYPDFDLLINKLDQIHLKKYFHIPWESFNDNLLLLKLIQTNQYFLNVSVKGLFIPDKIKTIAMAVEGNKKQVLWQFAITSKPEYEQATTIIEELDLENAEIKPVYTGHNLPFFEDYIFLTEEDLQHPGLNRREIFAHQALNTNDFGKLVVMPDGKIYANLHNKPLGTIDDDIRKLVYKEMDQGASWRRIRNMKPCSDCLYQWLCPSPSNYERAIGKPNLCHVEP